MGSAVERDYCASGARRAAVARTLTRVDVAHLTLTPQLD
jgi:hypothetical protein